MRIIRLAIGIAIVAEGAHSRDISLIIAGLIVSVLPIFNIGCCCGSSCEIPSASQRKQDIKMEE